MKRNWRQKLSFRCAVSQCRDNVSQFIVPLLTWIVVSRITLFQESLQWTNELKSHFCCLHFVLANVKSLQGNGRNRVLNLHLSLFTLFACYHYLKHTCFIISVTYSWYILQFNFKKSLDLDLPSWVRINFMIDQTCTRKIFELPFWTRIDFMIYWS